MKRRKGQVSRKEAEAQALRAHHDAQARAAGQSRLQSNMERRAAEIRARGKRR